MTGSESVLYCDMTFNGHFVKPTMESTNQTELNASDRFYINRKKKEKIHTLISTLLYVILYIVHAI